MRELLAELQSTLKRELESMELLNLEGDFYDTVSARLAEVSARAEGAENEAVLASIELARETLKKLFLLRLVKGLYHVWLKGSLPAVSLPRQEASILNAVLSAMERIASEAGASTSEPPARAEPAAARRRAGTLSALALFKKSHARLILSDGKLLGPFAPGDLAVIPLRDARELERLGAADVVASIAVGSGVNTLKGEGTAAEGGDEVPQGG